VHALELELLRKIDVTVLAQPTVYDCIREASGLQPTCELEKQKLLSYIDNYMCYVLVSMGLEVDVVLHCASAFLFFYAANANHAMIDFIVSVVRASYGKKPSFFERFDRVVGELVRNLKTLGNEAQLVDRISSGFEASRLFA